MDKVMTEGERTEGRRRLRLCLAASGGGHLRQILDLKPVWSQHDSYFVTEDTALGASLAETQRVLTVPHYGWGQLRMGAPLRVLGAAIKSVFQSAAIVLRERPDVIISTGAGAVFFTALWGRLFGAKIVVIESFARFEHPSLFGRLTKPFAHEFIVQSQQLAAHYPEARFFDPLQVLDTKVGEKKPLMFATVGAVLPFDRLAGAVAELKQSGEITEELILQVGEGGMRPEGVPVVETLPFDEIQRLLRDASVVVCHGGTGSIITALREGCHVIAMPRLASLNEVYDDHQLEITEAFEKRGLVLQAKSADELREALARTRTRERVVATTNPEGLIGFLNDYLTRLADARARS